MNLLRQDSQGGRGLAEISTGDQWKQKEEKENLDVPTLTVDI